ncbi:hypothetical protein N7522_009680 [Penicillium canescens]|uniref:Uncharacterized protein n=1 Tax=Penicillium canescens TaxID=5083 RepID=A0AAD6NCE0_PENCN|nr:uncharacterized protein N7446_006140 [Penicillium canescens]KAJ5990345.1 hypothetical protein N7522_010552 [Penicillium canescens]KAJ5998020.1 hypothetical protein N7522_009680 [Penicillium canescens]KAJ6051508.1 hypothetical protein N7460_002042 [Penicillium canescens]KAJ6062020.1 hypothetical protein N7446_006140 [Penicillium canescens]KAJ6065271.1 hypothetical protein N7444_000924 [Penicillium canescens]
MAGGLFCHQRISSEEHEQFLAEHDQKEREKSPEKSFIVDAISYELEGGRTLKAVLRDETGGERVSRLDLNKCIALDGSDLRYNRLTLRWTSDGGFFDQINLRNGPFIHEDREWGPMVCLEFTYTGGNITWGPAKKRINLGEHVYAKNGELGYFSWSGYLRGTPEPPRREPWRLYFEDIETARETASMAGFMVRGRDDEEFIIYDHYSFRDLWERFCHCFLELALDKKYGGFKDADGGDAVDEEHPSPLILWLQSQVKGGHIPEVKFVGNDSKAEHH